jgi:hypothetical protein
MAYIGFFPQTPGFTTANFRQNTATKKTESASGRIIRATNSTTVWTGTLQYPPMTLAESRPIQAFAARCQGSLNEFDIIIPNVSTTTSGYTAQLTYPTGTNSAGSTSCTVTSDQTSVTILKAGDVIRFPNHTKVYMVTEDVTTDGAGAATINFQPGLITAVNEDSAGATIQVTNVEFRMILSNDVQEFGYRTDGLVGYEIDVQEAV